MARGVSSIHYDRDVRRVGHDVIDCRSLLRLRDESFDIFAFRVGVNLVGHFDAAEAIAHVVVYAENALHVHVPFQGRGDRAQLNVAVLGNRGDTGGQATCQANQDVLDRRSTLVLGCKKFRVVSIEGKSFLVMLFLPQAVKTFHRRMTVSAILPFAGGGAI